MLIEVSSSLGRAGPKDAALLGGRVGSLGTVLAERASHALRLLEGSPLPAGRCIYRQYPSLSVQINSERSFLLQHCLVEPKAMARSTALLPMSVPAVKRHVDVPSWHDFVKILTRQCVIWLSFFSLSFSLSLSCALKIRVGNRRLTCWRGFSVIRGKLTRQQRSRRSSSAPVRCCSALVVCPRLRGLHQLHF